MKQLEFSYDMRLIFDAPVCGHHFTIKCTPLSDDRQKIEKLNIDIKPNKFLSDDYDSYGNKCIYGHMEGEHELFSIHVDGIATTGLNSKTLVGDIRKYDMYKYHTEKTLPGDSLKQFFKTIYLGNAVSDFDKAYELSSRLYLEMEYAKGVTDVNTTAEQAFSQRKGVCQDYAHILISLCRMAKISARYVVGFLMGEGESHAWVEVITKDGIYSFDPTNNLVVNDDHIKVSCGRDYNDCLINRGVFCGSASQKREIELSVKEIKGDIND